VFLLRHVRNKKVKSAEMSYESDMYVIKTKIK